VCFCNSDECSFRTHYRGEASYDHLQKRIGKATTLANMPGKYKSSKKVSMKSSEWLALLLTNVAGEESS